MNIKLFLVWLVGYLLFLWGALWAVVGIYFTTINGGIADVNPDSAILTYTHSLTFMVLGVGIVYLVRTLQDIFVELHDGEDEEEIDPEDETEDDS